MSLQNKTGGKEKYFRPEHFFRMAPTNTQLHTQDQRDTKLKKIRQEPAVCCTTKDMPQDKGRTRKTNFYLQNRSIDLLLSHEFLFFVWVLVLHPTNGTGTIYTYFK